MKPELQDLKDTYLRPILQLYQNIDEAMKKMKTEITQNCGDVTYNANDILTLRKELDELKRSNLAKVASPTYFASIGETLDEVARELSLRNKANLCYHL